MRYLRFVLLGLLVTGMLVLTGTGDAATGDTERVSVDSGGNEADGESRWPAVSSDGRFVVFHSAATNLVGGDTNGVLDVFVHDRQTGATERVSVDSGGHEANGNSGLFAMAVSSDGRFVVFPSAATNLVGGDTNGSHDVFVRDRQSGTTERVSVDSGANEANAGNFDPYISADGRYVSFVSSATNLVAGDTNGVDDAFVHDRQTGVTERVSVDSGGNEANGQTLPIAPISADGRYVTFVSSATDLVASD